MSDVLGHLTRQQFERVYTEWKTATWGEDIGRLFERLQAVLGIEEKS